MKKLLPAFFALSMLFLVSCNDSSDEVFADVQKEQATRGSAGDFDASRSNPK